MKKLYYISLVLLTAGCQVIAEEAEIIEEEVSVPAAGTHTLVLEASGEMDVPSRARIELDGSVYKMLWDGDEVSALFERNNVNSTLKRYDSSDIEVSPDDASATFSFSGMIPVDGATRYNYDFIFPAAAVSSVAGGVVSLSVPSSQTPLPATADPSATLLYASSAVNYPSQPSSLAVDYHHLAAYGRVNFTNLKLAAGETLTSITITAEDCDIAGTVTYDTADGSIAYSADDIHSITLSVGGLVVNPAGFDVWFACKPFTLRAGRRLTVTTVSNLFTRTATLTAKIDMEFEAGKVTEFPARPDDYPVTGKVWYVSNTSGNDSNDGLSPSKAFKNLYKVLEKIGPGDQVRLMPGTWSYGYDAITLNPENSGTAGNYISFVAHDPSNKPVINVSKAGAWNAVKCYASYIVFDGIEIVGNNSSISQSDALASAQYYSDNGSMQGGSSQTAIYNANGIAIEKKSGETYGPTHVIVRNCVVHDLPGGGIGAGGADHITFENNVIYNCAWYSMYANSGISVINPYNSDGETGYKIIIRGNTVSDCHTEVPWVRREIPSFNMSDGNGIIIDVNQSTSYTGRTLVENNVSFYNGGSGIHTYKANHVDIVGNTTYYNGRMYNGSYGEIWGNQSDDVHIWNNIMCGGRDAASSMCNLGDSDVVYTNNIYWQGTVTYTGSGDVVADPLFVNASTDRTVADFHLSAGSPAIGHGASLSYSPSRDHDGKLRGGSFDCGAYQY